MICIQFIYYITFCSNLSISRYSFARQNLYRNRCETEEIEKAIELVKIKLRTII